MRLGAHGEYVREGISCRNASEFIRIIDYRSEEVDSEHSRQTVVELPNGAIIARLVSKQ